MAGWFRPQHLPPGHAAGPQTRSRFRTAAVGPGIVLATGILFVLAAVYAAVRPRGSSPGVVIALAAFAVAFLAFAWFMARRFRPSRSPFSLTLPTREYRRGDSLRAELRLQNGSAPPEGLQVGIVCTEYYEVRKTTVNPDTGASQTRDTQLATAHEEWLPVGGRGKQQSFTFRLPPEGPFSHEGEVVSLAWRVSARVPRHLRRDIATDQPIWVRP